MFTDGPMVICFLTRNGYQQTEVVLKPCLYTGIMCTEKECLNSMNVAVDV